MYVYNVTC